MTKNLGPYYFYDWNTEGGGPNNSDILQNWFPAEIRSPLFNLQKFQDSKKSTTDSCRNDWNLMNDEVFATRKLSRLKYSRRDQTIHTFYKISSHQKQNLRSLICRNLRTLRKVLLIHAEMTENYWITKNLGPYNL